MLLKKLKLFDFVIAATLVLSSLVSYKLLSSKSDGEAVHVSVNSKPYSRWNLNVNKTISDTIKSNGETLVLERTNGTIRVKEATCPDKVCLHIGKICRNGERIICIPARVVIEIGEDKKGFDAITE
jgi:hypothetical protein